jgi:hypothetical protein
MFGGIDIVTLDFKAGTTLQQLSSTMDPITVESVALLVAFALLSLGMSSLFIYLAIQWIP